jgi:hypothetical protein
MTTSSTRSVFGGLLIWTSLFTWAVITVFLAVTKTTFPYYVEMSGLALAAISTGAGMLGYKSNR